MRPFDFYSFLIGWLGAFFIVLLYFLIEFYVSLGKFKSVRILPKVIFQRIAFWVWRYSSSRYLNACKGDREGIKFWKWISKFWKWIRKYSFRIWISDETRNAIKRLKGEF